MSDVFISYSRLDKDFVGHLRDTLAEKGQEVWIDWESIPPSQAWWNEIKKGIAKANNFVVVLSPNSMASPICHLEIEYARQVGKRIIPVLHLDYEREDVIADIAKRLANSEQDATRQLWGNRQPHDVYDANDSELKHINYFFFRPNDDFATRFAELFEVIRTDYQHKEQHTTLEIRASEWNRRGRDASFLLLDTELAQARAWLMASTDKVPPPTTLQQEYILASEKRTRQLRRIRRTSIVGSTIAVIALIFAMGASMVGRQAIDDVNDANTEVARVDTKVAHSENRIQALNLASNATTLLSGSNDNLELASLLSIQALNTIYTEQADAVLVKATEGLFAIQRFAGHSDSVSSVALSPDGKFALSGSYDKTVRLWDITTGQSLRVFSGHSATVTSVAFSPDGYHVLSGSADTTLRLWDVETGETLRIFSGHEGAVNNVVFSLDGTRILSGSQDATLILWDVETGEKLQIFTGHTKWVTSVALSPDGQFALSGSADNTLILWDMLNGEALHIFTEHTDIVTTVAFSPDSRYILSSSNDNTLRRWNIMTGANLGILRQDIHGIRSLAFSPDGHSIVIALSNKTLQLLDIETGETLRIFSGHTALVSGVSFSPDGHYILSGAWDHTLRLWDANLAEHGHIFTGHTSVVSSVAFSPDGHYALSASWDKTVRLWDVLTKTQINIFTALTYSLMFSPAGDYFIGNYPSLWNAKTGELVRSFKGDNAESTSAVISSDGRYVLSGSRDTTLRLWDVETGTSLRVFEGHTYWVNSVAFSPDNHYALSGSEDTTLRLWDVETGTSLHTFTGHKGAVTSVAFSPDGKYVVSSSADSTLILWDVQTGAILRIFEGHTGMITNVVFSPDGHYLLSGGKDTTLRLWRVETGENLRIYTGHTDTVRSVAFSPDGQYVLSGSDDHTLRLWYTDYHDLINYACTRIFRPDLTTDERIQYGIRDEKPTCPQFAQNE